MNLPQALQIDLPSASRRHSGVSGVPQSLQDVGFGDVGLSSAPVPVLGGGALAAGGSWSFNGEGGNDDCREQRCDRGTAV